jgi:hypothetical protein
MTDKLSLLKVVAQAVNLHKGLALRVSIQLAGVVTIIVVASLEIASKHSPLHLIWFVPTVVLFLCSGVWLGYRQQTGKVRRDV